MSILLQLLLLQYVIHRVLACLLSVCIVYSQTLLCFAIIISHLMSFASSSLTFLTPSSFLCHHRERQRRHPRGSLVYSAVQEAQEREAPWETPQRPRGPPNACTSQTSPSASGTPTSGKCLG